MRATRVKKILIVLGTRPEAIKLSPVIAELRRRAPRFDVRVCSTGQHAALLKQALDRFHIAPDYDLKIMRRDQGLAEMTARILARLNPVLERERPRLVLVQGDTTTALAAALAAASHRLPVGHIEAGLRTEDKANPFPEEINRRLITTLADFHFAPTAAARRNLIRAGADPARVFLTGNTIVDGVRQVMDRWRRGDTDGLSDANALVERARRGGARRFILFTCHRRESFGRDLANICTALLRIARAHPDVAILCPAHPNPRALTTVRRLLGHAPNIHIVKPLPYEAFLHLMSRSDVVLTDSGGVQEEAPSLGKPVLVIRNKTERPEGIRRGLARLVGTATPKIVSEVERCLRRRRPDRLPGALRNPYGSGHAARRIADILEKVI